VPFGYYRIVPIKDSLVVGWIQMGRSICRMLSWSS
jgi:hypothetical protein